MMEHSFAMNSDEYEAGRRDGMIDGLHKTVEQLTHDVETLKKAVWLLYGAIFLVQFFLPLIQKQWGG